MSFLSKIKGSKSKDSKKSNSSSVTKNEETKVEEKVQAPWRPSQDYMLMDEALRNALIAHAKPQQIDENIEFLFSVNTLYGLKKEKQIKKQLRFIYKEFIADDRKKTNANIADKLKGFMDSLFGPDADDEKTQPLTIEAMRKVFDTDYRIIYGSVQEFIFRYKFYESKHFKNALKKNKRKYGKASKDVDTYNKDWLLYYEPEIYNEEWQNSLQPSSSKGKQSKSKPQNRNKKGDSKHHSSRKWIGWCGSDDGGT